MVGIRDVARKANVSPATVSRVLNEDKTISVSVSTRQRIFEAAATLNYDINKRKYVKKRLPSIGVISAISKASEEKDIYYKDLRAGLEEEASRLHIGMNRMYNVSDNPRKWKDLNQLGALIVVGTIAKPAIADLLAQNQHLIVVDNPDIQQEVDMVYADLERMTKAVLELFIEQGHTNIAYIGGYQIDINELGEKSTTENEKRLRAYLHFMRDNHLEKQINYYLGEWTEESGERLTKKLLNKQKQDLPTAILIGSDPLALGVYKALQKENIIIGKDIVLVSFDNIEAIAHLSPGLTSVAINAKAIGQSAVRLAVERIDHLRDDPIILTYPTKLVVRESFIPNKWKR
ncbi:LacI family transcriptional regulator [Enterococcus villorum]|uniref:LacI family transcriptional regulator n=3 Tax=Enterococcus villorum TaxID=112904 RepID=A0A1V8YLU3_9ENTE|nr:LacI family DNA-binding transcriptional regulator [Enterococcus villorum]OQO71572.1 LacI family transcriptional regulator [Enterococcus villorum]OQO73591.1 LacI family transcriptional regulator [Enterococcus villorum]